MASHRGRKGAFSRGVEEAGVGEDDDVVESGLRRHLGGRRKGRGVVAGVFGWGKEVDGLVWPVWIRGRRMVRYCLSTPDVLLAMCGSVTGRTGYRN